MSEFEENTTAFQPMDNNEDMYTAAPVDAFSAPPAEYPTEDAPAVYESNQFDQFDAPAPPADDYIGDIDAAPAVPEYESMPAVMVAPPPPVEDVPLEEEEAAVSAPVTNEISPMTAWNNEWQVTLKERKDTENALKAQHVQAAEESLTVFAAERESKREMRMQKNRADEQDKLEAIEADLENDNSWQRVVKMVELNQDNAEEAVDCARMRDVLIFMKNDTDRATILA
jgi:hypothetical protein